MVKWSRASKLEVGVADTSFTGGRKAGWGTQGVETGSVLSLYLGGVHKRRLKQLKRRFVFQEQGNEKTNNGTHYKLQLLYSNGERSARCPARWPPLSWAGALLTLASPATAKQEGEGRLGRVSVRDLG